jgi:hypothetical protein
MLIIMAIALAAPVSRAAAPAGRYTTAADTVKDNKTGLTWQRVGPTTPYYWADAKTYCQALSLGGFSSGWRLPTKKELETLVDRRVASPGPTIDSAFPNTPANAFWTSTPYAADSSPDGGSPDGGSPGRAWRVHFGDGNSYSYDTTVTVTFNVRCAR